MLLSLLGVVELFKKDRGIGVMVVATHDAGLMQVSAFYSAFARQLVRASLPVAGAAFNRPRRGVRDQTLARARVGC
jgi:hypothetical protein